VYQSGCDQSAHFGRADYGGSCERHCAQLCVESHRLYVPHATWRRPEAVLPAVTNWYGLFGVPHATRYRFLKRYRVVAGIDQPLRDPSRDPSPYATPPIPRACELGQISARVRAIEQQLQQPVVHAEQV
jgi:hypothetical protein